ncbi:MAG TPA: squalene/phytoene synthase family protein [Solirubrobacteraceae bacterium]|nr:squalene/phytoene synthase family protein [Solirubrobacteraceae bacterium]
MPALEVEHAYRQCEQITRHEAANFYYGIRLLPRSKREAMSAVYAFARRVDDIGDGSLEPELQLAALAIEREALAGVDAGTVDGGDPVLVGLAHAHRHYDLPLDALTLLIEGVELDVLGTRYETFDDLVGYCRRVAGSVGRLCLAIFAGGVNRNGNGAAALADDLGVAMQLTNILRDVREDRERGRVYLPAEDLRRFGCIDVPAAADEGSTALIRYEAARAAEWFDRGLRLIEMLDSRSASCVLAMTGIYRSILDRIAREPDQVFLERISLPPWGKAWVAARSLAAARPSGAVR